MRFLRAIPAGLLWLLLSTSWTSAKPFNLQNGERPSGWKVVGGNELAWRFLNGALNSGDGDAQDYKSPCYFVMDSPADMARRDYVVTASVRSYQENGIFTLLVRYQDQQNYYGLEYSDRYLNRSRMGRVRLVKVKDGEIRYQKTVGHGFRYDNRAIPDMTADTVQLKIEADGDHIRAWVNDDLEMEIEDADFQKGTVGFANFFYHVEIFDFAVENLQPAEPVTPAAAVEGPARIEFRENFSEGEARAIKDYLDSQRFPDVEVVQEGNRWIVRTAYFPSVEQAQLVLNILESEKITGGTIVPQERPAPAATPAAAPGPVYAVVVAEYESLEDANVHKNSLTDSGLPDARIVQDPATAEYKVLFGTFDTEAQAKDAAARVNTAGFTTIGTLAVPRQSAAAPVTDVSELTNVILKNIMNEIGPGLTDQGKVNDALAKYNELLNSMDERDQIIRKLTEQIKQLTAEQKAASDARRADEQKEIDRLIGEAKTHLADDDLDNARIKANMIFQLDPVNSDARLLLDQIRRRELDLARAAARTEREAEIGSRLAEARALATKGNWEDARIQLNNVIGLGARESELSEQARHDLDEARELLGTVVQSQKATEIEKLNRLAYQARERGDLERELIYLESLAGLDTENREVHDRILEVTDALRNRTGSSKREKLILYGLVLFVALFALFYFLTWFLYRRDETVPGAGEEAVLQVTYEPATDNFQEEEPAFVDESVALNFGGVVPLEDEVSAAEGASEDTAVSGKGVAVAEPPRTPAQQPPAEPARPPEEPSGPDLSGADRGGEELPPGAAGTEPAYGSLDDLLSDEEDRTDMAPGFGDLDLLEPVSPEEETPPADETEPETLEPLEPETEETAPEEVAPAPAVEPTAPGQSMLPEPVEGNLLFKQGIDNLSEGAAPPNWEVEGATLTVAPEGKGGIGKCLRFDKPAGSNALARCRFPGIRNIFRTEMDVKSEPGIEGELVILLEHENEAPGLVRVSVAGGGSDLLLQGTRTQSEPGEWRHVKFIINLDKQVVNGFVDGKLIAYKVSLEAAPDLVNCISLQADSTAAGAILIDNIKIYRV